jgi:hypothetical protein
MCVCVNMVDYASSTTTAVYTSLTTTLATAQSSGTLSSSLVTTTIHTADPSDTTTYTVSAVNAVTPLVVQQPPTFAPTRVPTFAKPTHSPTKKGQTNPPTTLTPSASPTISLSPTEAPTETINTESTSAGGNNVSSGEFAGIVIGVIVVCGLIGFLFYYLITTRNAAAASEDKYLETSSPESHIPVDIETAAPNPIANAPAALESSPNAVTVQYANREVAL